MDVSIDEVFSPNFDKEIKRDVLISLISDKESINDSWLEDLIADYLIGQKNGVQTFYTRLEHARNKDRSAIANLNSLLAKAILCLEEKLDKDTHVHTIKEAKELWLNKNPRYYSTFRGHEKETLLKEQNS